MDAAGDVTVLLEANDPWSGHFIFKTSAEGMMASPTYWIHEFQWTPVSVTLPTGETIAVNQGGVQKLAR